MKSLLAVGALLALTVAFDWHLLRGPTLLGTDTATAFYPWYAFLGEQLRNGHLPVWNPHQFSGTPFAADPESGWMYLPAMLAFTILPLDVAARTHMLFHVALAGMSTYALARTIGASVGGALVAATAYAHTGFLEGHSVCCFAYSSVAAWLPLMLLGAERAINAIRPSGRVAWWGVSGVAFSQILSVWVGQAAYYAALVLGGYIAYRTLLGHGGVQARAMALLMHTTGILLFGCGLAAAGLLPRLEYNLLSNLPGGYPDAGAVLPAATWTDWGFVQHWDQLLLAPGFHYVGWTTLGLAIAGVLITRRPSAVAYFGLLPVAVLILARYEPTPLHSLASMLPGFERIHLRSPERAMMVFYLGPALLAGIAVTRLASFGTRAWLKTALAVLAIGLVWADLHSAWTAQAAEARGTVGAYQLEPADLATYYAPTPAAVFLMRSAEHDRFRYFGHAQHVDGGPMPYTLRWAEPGITSLEVNNRALISGLDDIQGYNPVHLARYDEFMSVLNGTPQNYHHADVLQSGLSSPLLDLLNARYVIVPRSVPHDQLAPRFDRPMRVAYEDQHVQVLENVAALPRAWLVHAAEQVAPGQAAQRLASGQVDARRIALLETPPPVLGEPADPRADAVQLLSYAADRIQLRSSSSAPGLVVLSEVYYPAWHAYVDGQPSAVYVADHTLRAVSVPAGGHVVDMRYESLALAAGLTISLIATAALIVMLGILVRATT